MTHGEILKMEAGYEINKLIDNKIFNVNDMLVPNYSADIFAAWKVVEKMQENGYCFDADGNALRRRIRFGVGQEIGEAKTMPLAICRAALLAVME